MRRFAFAVIGLLVVGTAFAQVTSDPGRPADAEPHFNFAHADITLDLDLPNQVSFELPALQFAIAMNHLVPNNTVTINIRVRNTSDRRIKISDPNFAGGAPLLGFSLVGADLELPAGAAGYFQYVLTTGDVDGFNTLIQALNATPSVSGVYNYDGNILTLNTALVAEGMFAAGGNTSAFFNLP